MAAALPPLPYFLPDVGSVWYCTVPTNWPNSVYPQALWGSIITVTGYSYLSGKWYIRFNSKWNADHTVIGCKILPADFNKVFTQQPILVRKAMYSGGGTCDLTNPCKPIYGTGRGWVGRFTEVQPLAQLQ